MINNSKYNKHSQLYNEIQQAFKKADNIRVSRLKTPFSNNNDSRDIKTPFGI